ncbi:hypothetical protein [Paenibacillus guangzhouensis]|uniref:hypothetical protein n=1 Tax=Paenibacillus guangzhouensis TaxID=1473112 RepID=UPI001D102DA1|nr:hypothetical protein [Paenibacillus guangzhouensis]
MLLTILIFPGHHVTVGAARTEFGFPFRFVTQYHNEIVEGHRWFLRGIRIDLLYFLLDVAIIYVIIHGLLYFVTKLKSQKK